MGAGGSGLLARPWKELGDRPFKDAGAAVHEQEPDDRLIGLVELLPEPDNGGVLRCSRTRDRDGQRRKACYAQPCQWFVHREIPWLLISIPQVVTHGFRSAIWPLHGGGELANRLGAANVVPRIYASSIQRHRFSVTSG